MHKLKTNSCVLIVGSIYGKLSMCPIILNFFNNDTFDTLLFSLIVIFIFHHFINQNNVVLSAGHISYVCLRHRLPFLFIYCISTKMCKTSHCKSYFIFKIFFILFIYNFLYIVYVNNITL